MNHWNPAPYARIVVGDMVAIAVGVIVAWGIGIAVLYRREFGGKR